MPASLLILLGHPRTESLNGALAKAYRDGAEAAGAATRLIALEDLRFDPVTPPYGTPVVLEPDLVSVQAALTEARHVAVFFPNWWGGAPGPFKSLLERVLLPGFAFRYQKGQPLPAKLLAGRTSEIVVTMDTPPFIHRFFYGAAGDRVMKARTLDFCGLKPIKTTHFGPVLSSTSEKRAAWIERARRLGHEAARRMP